MTSNINNPMQLLELIKNTKNPSDTVLKLLEQQAASNPIFANILNLTKNGQPQAAEDVIKNLFKERGLDYEKEFNDFKRKFGL